jgi:DNA-binding transcriptional MerR regulator
MFRIGDFSRIARVSARLLRFYDEVGLLTPAHADPQTGYRFYTVDQLPQLNRILVLKELGFTLEQVRDIVGAQVGPGQLRQMLLMRRNDVARSLAEEAQRLHHIETRIAQLDEDGGLSDDDVVLRAEPVHRVVSLRRTVRAFGEALALIGELRREARPLLPRGSRPTLIAVSHSREFEQDEIDIEFAWTLDQAAQVELPAGSPLVVRELEAVPRMAVCVKTGPPQDAHLASARIGRSLEARGDRLAGPSREFFLQPPDPERMHEAVMEMQFPVEAVPR